MRARCGRNGIGMNIPTQKGLLTVAYVKRREREGGRRARGLWPAPCERSRDKGEEAARRKERTNASVDRVGHRAKPPKQRRHNANIKGVGWEKGGWLCWGPSADEYYLTGRAETGGESSSTGGSTSGRKDSNTERGRSSRRRGSKTAKKRVPGEEKERAARGGQTKNG